MRENFELVVERSPTLTHRFYEILFERYPAARALFPANSRVAQEGMLTSALVAVMDHLEDAPWLQNTLHGLGGLMQGGSRMAIADAQGSAGG